jgi:hypothetical protein
MYVVEFHLESLGFSIYPSSGILDTRGNNDLETGTLSDLKPEERHLLCWFT